MHLNILARGNLKQFETWKQFLSSQMLTMKRKNLITNEEEVLRVQLAVRPVQLFELVFPEEELGKVLGLLEINEAHLDDMYGSFNSKMQMKILRKMLACEPIPKDVKIIKPKWANLIDEEGNKTMEFIGGYVPPEGMGIHPIGIKKEPKREMKFPNGEHFFQEPI